MIVVPFFLSMSLGTRVGPTSNLVRPLDHNPPLKLQIKRLWLRLARLPIITSCKGAMLMHGIFGFKFQGRDVGARRGRFNCRPLLLRMIVSSDQLRDMA